MIDWLLKKIIGGKSKRYRFMIVYTIIFVVLSILKSINEIAFATFSTAFLAWLGVDTIKKGDD